jgi:hypothetical protein
MHRTFTAIFTFVCFLFLCGLADSAKIKSYWKNPSATESSLQFTKVLVVVAIKQEFTRKVAEDKIVRIIQDGGRAEAVPSYTILQPSEFDDKEAAKSKVEELGFDGLIVLKYATSVDTKKYEQTTEWEDYNYFWGVYYPAWGAVYNSTSEIDNKLFVETMFYSLKEQKLIWSGISETKNPKNPAKVVGEIAEETAKYLQKQGLLAKKKE